MVLAPVYGSELLGLAIKKTRTIHERDSAGGKPTTASGGLAWLLPNLKPVSASKTSVFGRQH